MALVLQLVLEAVVTSSVGQSDVGVLAADPLDRLEREGSLLGSRAVDPTLVAVAQHLAPADVAGRDDGDGGAVSLLCESYREGPLPYRQDRRWPAPPVRVTHAAKQVGLVCS